MGWTKGRGRKEHKRELIFTYWPLLVDCFRSSFAESCKKYSHYIQNLIKYHGFYHGFYHGKFHGFYLQISWVFSIGFYLQSITVSKFAVIIEYIDNILVNENPLIDFYP